MKFTLEIELGNDAMQTPADVRETLMDIAALKGTLAHLTKFGCFDAGNIRDVNGNIVGKWEVVE